MEIICPKCSYKNPEYKRDCINCGFRIKHDKKENDVLKKHSQIVELNKIHNKKINDMNDTEKIILLQEELKSLKNNLSKIHSYKAKFFWIDLSYFMSMIGFIFSFMVILYSLWSNLMSMGLYSFFYFLVNVPLFGVISEIRSVIKIH